MGDAFPTHMDSFLLHVYKADLRPIPNDLAPLKQQALWWFTVHVFCCYCCGHVTKMQSLR